MSFSIEVTKDYTGFAAGHFATFENGDCEPLHGHNYQMMVRLEGRLDANGYVFNFVPLKKAMRALCDRLDHHMLLPTKNPYLSIERDAASVTVRHRHKTYVFPVEDVLQLPIPNTSVEYLAWWLASELAAYLRTQPAQQLTALIVEVAEKTGQAAVYRMGL